MPIVVALIMVALAIAAPASASLSQSPPRVSTAAPAAGSVLRVTARFANRGDHRTRPLRATIVLSRDGARDVVLARRSIGRLRPDAARTWRPTVTVPGDVAPATYRLGACLQASDRRPSCRTTRLTVGAQSTTTGPASTRSAAAPVLDVPAPTPATTPARGSSGGAGGGGGTGGAGGGGGTGGGSGGGAAAAAASTVDLSAGALAANASILAGATPETELATEGTSFIRGVWYQQASKVSPPATYARGVNADWEQGRRGDWFVELQAGDQQVIGGILDGDARQIDFGLRVLDWGFDHQLPDGSFSGQTAHSTLFFVNDVARALVLLERSPYAAQYAGDIGRQAAALRRTAGWLTSPAVWSDSVAKNRAMYGHRHFRDAAALGLTALLTDDRALMSFARSELQAGLDSQAPAGWIPEYGGYDVGYNGVALWFAIQWRQYFPSDPLTARLDLMIDRAMAWETTWVAPDGHLEIGSSTRSCVLSQGHSGELNPPGYASVAHSMAAWAALQGRADLDALARTVWAYRASGAPQCPA